MTVQPRCVSITFEGAPGEQVALVGDFPDWKHAVPMVEMAPGCHGCTVELEPGLYRYRFLVGGRKFVSDPHPRVVDHAEGHDNAVLVVEGAAPPLHFAPDRQHVGLDHHGRLVVHAEVDHGVAVPRHVWVRAPWLPSGLVRFPTQVAHDHGGRTGFTATGWLQVRDGNGARPPRNHELREGCFGFADHAAPAFALPAPCPEQGRAPAWVEGAVFYGIFVDRWRRSGRSPPDPRVESLTTVSRPNTFYGGDLPGITESLDEIQALGVDALVLTPVHHSNTPHRYDGLDLLTVDARLGGEPALRTLVHEAHARGMRVVVDLAVTHVSGAHPAFVDVLRNQQHSPFAPWFRIKRFPVLPADPTTYHHYCERFELPLLNLEPGPAREHAVEAALRLVEMGVDGLRLDAMDDAPAAFWADLRARLRARKPDLLLLGEIVSDRPSRLMEQRGVDIATDFQHREAMLAFLGRGAWDAAGFWSRVCLAEHRLGPLGPSARLLFLDNHDTARFLSLAGTTRRLHLALAYLMFRPEPVCLTYGTEVDLCVGQDLGFHLDDAWPERMLMPASGGEPPAYEAEGGPTTRALLGQLARVRRTLLTSAGGLLFVEADGPVLVLERLLKDGSRVRAWFNAGEGAPRPVQIPRGAAMVLSVNDPGAGVDAPLAPLSARLLRLGPVVA